MHDGRLRTVALALQRRLQSQGLLEVVDASAPSSSQQQSHLPRVNFDAASREDLDPEEWVRTYVTGKGLDVIIDEVKKRTGVSPFLRGKHSSLDPFGTVSVDADAENGGRKAVVYMPTFQAEKYVHEVPVEVDPAALSGMIGSKKAGKRKASSPLRTESEGEDAWQSAGSDVDAMSVKTSSSRMQSASPPLHSPAQDLPGGGFPSVGFELPVSHSRIYTLDGSGPQRPAPSHAHPSPYARPAVKKRRLAPAPSDSIARNVPSDPLRIYHNHLQTG